MIKKDTIIKLERIRDAQKNRDSIYRSAWKKVAQYIDPWYGSMDMDNAPTPSDAPIKNEIYDSTILSYSNIFAMGLQGYVCSSQSSFFSLAPEKSYNMSDAQNTQLKEVLQSRTRKMYQIFSQRGFYNPLYSFFKSFGDLSTAIMFFNITRDDKITFEQVPNYQCVPLYNKTEGLCDTIFRSLWLSRYEAGKLFGEDNLPSYMKGNDIDESESCQFWELLCPRDRFGFDIESKGDWEHLDIIWDAKELKVVFEGGSTKQRFCLCPFSKIDDGTAWGVGGPGLRQFNNALCLQRMNKDLLTASQYAASPAIMKSSGFSAKIAPAAFIDIPAGASMAPLQLGQDLSWTTQAISDRRLLAKSDYFVDYFLMLSQYSGNVNTATLAQGLQNEQLKMMTHFLDSLRTGFFEPVIDWTWNAMGELGYFDDGYSIDYKSLQVDFISPLFILQKQAVSLEPTTTVMNNILPFLNIDPSLVSYIDFSNYIAVLRDATNADVRIIRDKEKAEAMIQEQQRTQAEIQAKQQAIAQQEADTREYEAATKAPEQGSVAEKLQENKYSNLKFK